MNNLPLEQREQEIVDSIESKIKGSIHSAGFLTYKFTCESSKGLIQYSKGEIGGGDVTLSFNLYPLKSDQQQEDNIHLDDLEEKVGLKIKNAVEEIIYNVTKDFKVNKVLRNVRSDSKVNINVSYVYDENGLDFYIALGSLDGKINYDTPNLTGIKKKFLDRQNQIATDKYGFKESKTYRNIEGNWLKRAALHTGYGVADFGKWLWSERPGSSKRARRNLMKRAEGDLNKFEKKINKACEIRDYSHFVAKAQGAIDNVVETSEEISLLIKEKNKELAESIKNITLGSSINMFREQIDEEHTHRKNYGVAVNQLQNLIKLVDNYIDLEEDGIPLCFPQINPKEQKSINVKNLYPIRLIAAGEYASDIVPSDINLNGSPLIITGENGGGKSIYLYSIADMLVQAQTGLPILADEAELSVVEGIYLHFVKPGDIQQGQSRFINEVERVKDIVSRINPYDVALFDELGSGTDLEGAMYVSELVTDNLAKNGISTVLVTHLGDFARESQKKGYRVVKAKDFEFEDGIGSSKGKSVAAKRGLTQDFFDTAMKNKE